VTTASRAAATEYVEFLAYQHGPFGLAAARLLADRCIRTPRWAAPGEGICCAMLKARESAVLGDVGDAQRSRGSRPDAGAR